MCHSSSNSHMAAAHCCRYNRAGDELQHALVQAALPTADKLLPIMRGDEMQHEYGAFTAWMRAVIESLAERKIVESSRAVLALYALGSTVEASPRRSIASSVHPSTVMMRSPARQLLGIVQSSNELLGDPTWEHSTRLIVLDLSRHDQNQTHNLIAYAPGDRVKVYACNPTDVVALAASHIGLSLNECIDLRPHIEIPPDAATAAHHPQPSLSRMRSVILVEKSHFNHSNNLASTREVTKHDSSASYRPPFPVPTTLASILERELGLMAPPSVALMNDLAALADKNDRSRLLRYGQVPPPPLVRALFTLTLTLAPTLVLTHPPRHPHPILTRTRTLTLTLTRTLPPPPTPSLTNHAGRQQVSDVGDQPRGARPGSVLPLPVALSQPARPQLARPATLAGDVPRVRALHPCPSLHLYEANLTPHSTRDGPEGEIPRVALRARHPLRPHRSSLLLDRLHAVHEPI